MVSKFYLANRVPQMMLGKDFFKYASRKINLAGNGRPGSQGRGIACHAILSTAAGPSTRCDTNRVK